MSAWGNSWASAWGDSWGAIAGAQQATWQYGGTSKRDKKRKRPIYFSDLAERERREKAILASTFVPIVPEVIEDEEDELLIRVLMVTLH